MKINLSGFNAFVFDIIMNPKQCITLINIAAINKMYNMSTKNIHLHLMTLMTRTITSYAKIFSNLNYLRFKIFTFYKKTKNLNLIQ